MHPLTHGVAYSKSSTDDGNFKFVLKAIITL